MALPNGQVVETGSLQTFSTMSFVVARFNADGTPDTTFGTNGYFTDPALSSNTLVSPVLACSGNALAVDSNGDLVVAGVGRGKAVALRLTTTGTLDTTFGTGGIVTLGTPNTVNGLLNVASAVSILPDAQIAIGGTVQSTSTDQVPAVEELNADGSIADGFGSSGLAEVPLPSGASGFSNLNTNNVFGAFGGLVEQPDGKLVVAANAVPSSNGVDSSPVEIVALRLTTAGTPDTSFGTDGFEILTAKSLLPTGTSLGVSALALQPDGKIVLGGATSYTAGVTSPTQVTVLRLDADGTPDTTFGIGGADILTNRVAPESTTIDSLTLQADGKIVAGHEFSPALSRFDTNGLPDTSFGTGGTTLFPTSNNATSGISVIGVSVLSDGKIVGQLQGGGTPGLIRTLAAGSQGDYNDDGISDPAVLNVNTATFSDAPSGGRRPESVQFGDPGFDQTYPAPGDYDGSGKTELAAYFPSLGEFIYRPANGGADIAVPLGVVGAGKAIPAPADYFGLGHDDFAVYLTAQAAFEIKNPVNGAVYTIPFGTPGAGNSIPVPGDYDGSGHAELAVYLPASGDIIYRPASGGADVTIPIGTPGVAASIPEIGDFDGVGHDEAAVYEPGTGTFVYQPGTGGSLVSISLGTAGQTVPFSLGTDSVAEAGIGGSGSPGALVLPASVDIPLTQADLDQAAGPLVKKPAGNG